MKRTRFLYQFLSLIFILTFAVVGRAELNSSNVPEIKRQWDYLNHLKASEDKAIKKKSKKLLQFIRDHLLANNVHFEEDPINSAALLIQVLTKSELQEAHTLNRFATSLSEKNNGLRIEINPLKLKIDEAGAMFDEETNRLTLAYDNIVNLAIDSFVGHELIHARFYQIERRGQNHVYMGWLKRQESTSILQETYPDSFSLDELPAYYYHCLTLLYEALREGKLKNEAPDLSTARDFVGIGLKLVSYLRTQEISQFTVSYLQEENPKQVSFHHDKAHDIVRVKTQRFILDLNFVRSPKTTRQELQALALTRMRDLNLRTQIIARQFKLAAKAIEAEDGQKALDELSSERDLVLNPSSI